MSLKVTTSQLPHLFDPTKLVSWANDMVSRVTDQFTTISQRVNKALLSDGSEAMSGKLPLATVAFASLPASPALGWMVVVSNSNTGTWGATVSGTGAFKVIAWYNGTNWTVVGV